MRMAATDDTSQRPSLTVLLGGGGLILVVGVMIYRWWTAPPVVELDNLKYIQLLWTATSSRNPEWLAKVQVAVDQQHQANEMTPAAYQEFCRIIGLAKKDQWEAASKESYELARGQLSRSRPAQAAKAGEHSHDHDHAH